MIFGWTSVQQLLQFSQLSEVALLYQRGYKDGAGIVSFLQLADLSTGLQLCNDWPRTLGYFMHWNVPAELVMNLFHPRIAGLVTTFMDTQMEQSCPTI